MRLSIPLLPEGPVLPGVLKAWPLVMAPDLHTMSLELYLEPSRSSGSSGLADRMLVSLAGLPPAPSHSDAESPPVAAPLLHLDLPTSVMMVFLVAVVDLATLIHVHLSHLFWIHSVKPVIFSEEESNIVWEILLLPSLWAAVVVYVVVRSLALVADRTGSCLLC